MERMMPMARMRISITLLSVTLLVLLISMLTWLARLPEEITVTETSTRVSTYEDAAILKLGIIPERNIFEQRRRYRMLADYLSDVLERRVTLVTSSTYHGALNDMAEGRTDAAFMGSMVAALSLDQIQAQVLVKPQTADGVSTYRGVIFVRDDSPIQSLEDMAGRSIAMVRTTTAGHLFPIYSLNEYGFLTGERAVAMRWVGTHDQVIHEVAHGRVDAGAAKDLRIDAHEQSDPTTRYRWLSLSEAVPNNALLVRRNLDEAFVQQLKKVLLEMDQHESGRQALSVFGAERFLPCERGEYQAVYDMTEQLGPGWGKIGQATPSVSTLAPVMQDAGVETQKAGGP
jgi:phosphonate transport system substrate-binding protein